MTEPSSTPPAPPPPEPAPEGSTVSTVANAIIPLMRLLPPPPVGTILTPPEQQEPARRGWFFLQVWMELRLAVQMYFDPRYRISRTAQVAFPLVAALFVANYFLFGWLALPIISQVAERLLDAALAVVAYRVLLRELDRYRAVLDYLARFSAR